MRPFNPVPWAPMPCNLICNYKQRQLESNEENFSYVTFVHFLCLHVFGS